MKSFKMMLLAATHFVAVASFAQADTSQKLITDKSTQTRSYPKQLNLSSKEKMKEDVMKSDAGGGHPGSTNFTSGSGLEDQANPTISLKEKMKGKTKVEAGDHPKPGTNKNPSSPQPGGQKNPNLSLKEKMKIETMKQEPGGKL